MRYLHGEIAMKKSKGFIFGVSLVRFVCYTLFLICFGSVKKVSAASDTEFEKQITNFYNAHVKNTTNDMGLEGFKEIVTTCNTPDDY